MGSNSEESEDREVFTCSALHGAAVNTESYVVLNPSTHTHTNIPSDPLRFIPKLYLGAHAS